MTQEMDLATTDMDLAHIMPVDQRGNPSALQAGTKASYSVTPAGVVSLFPSDDGTSVNVVAVGVGSAVVTISGTSAAGKAIVASFGVVVSLADAAGFKIQFDGPVPQA